MPRKTKTTEQFIKEAIAVHGQRYRYDFVVYLGKRVRVYILCLGHGPFLQNPEAHIRGSGCLDCGLISRSSKRRKPLDEFIKEAREIHGDFYNYSLVEYINTNTHVTIVCPQHGEFPQTPDKHLSGRGCPKCGLISRSDKRRKPNDEFIKEAREIHGDFYNYSLVKYVGANEYVTIVCPQHGEFPQTPSSHVNQGQGCPDCGLISRSDKRRKPLDKFIKEAKEVHGDFYDYSLVKYINANTHVTIVCPQHGEFPQTPSSHVNQGQGCPKCGGVHMWDNRKINRLDARIAKWRKIGSDLRNK